MSKNTVKKKSSCRICKGNRLTKILSLGKTPLANAFLTKEQIKKKEKYYPLELYFCHQCSLTQLGHIVSPDVLFKNYVYVSSTSSVFIKHFEDFATSAIKRFKLTKNSLVIDIGSNDGILLKPFKKKKIQVLGIEPAKNIAQKANKEGIKTLPYFFSVNLAKKIRKKYGPAHLITATNVFAHINDLDEVIKGLRLLLDKEGVFVIEAPYLVDFIEKNLFDTIYHEHLSYLAINPLIYLFKRSDMKIFDVERVTSHGGSIRVYVAKNKTKYKISKDVLNLCKLEKRIKLDNVKTYQLFAKQIEKNKKALLKLIKSIKKRGESIVGYGAPAKGNTLLNYFGIDHAFLNYIVDDSMHKQGLYTPGTHVEVTKPEQIYKDKPDYVLILAWNFAESIMKKHKKYHEQGGKFIIPVPEVKII